MVFWLIAALSVVMFAASLVLVPWLLVAMPGDLLVRDPPWRTRWGRHHPALRIGLLVAKNAFAWLLVVAGVAMLVLPGQGLLTILVGLMLADFPGKHRLLRAVLTRPKVLRAVNWLRSRAGRPPLETERRRLTSPA